MGAGGVIKVTVVDADFVASAMEVAVTVTVAGEGTVIGAVYVTGPADALDAGDTLPQAAPEHPAPLTVQLTPLLAESFATVAVSVCVCPACTIADAGVTLTAIAEGGGAGVPPPLCEAVPAQPDRNTIARKKGATAR